MSCYCGKSKQTNSNVFMERAMEEINHILHSGLAVDGNHYQVELDDILGDPPARAAIKDIKSHSGYSGCERC